MTNSGTKFPTHIYSLLNIFVQSNPKRLKKRNHMEQDSNQRDKIIESNGKACQSTKLTKGLHKAVS